MMVDIVEFRILSVFAVIGLFLTLFLLGVAIAATIDVAKKEKARKK